MLEKRTTYVATCDKCGTTQDLMVPYEYDARRLLIEKYKWIVLKKDSWLTLKPNMFFMCPDCVKKYIKVENMSEDLRKIYENDE